MPGGRYLFSDAPAGQRDFGENFVQEGVEKIEELAENGLTWHFIGHLQSNKAKLAVATFDWIHSSDSLDLLTRVNRLSAEIGTTIWSPACFSSSQMPRQVSSSMPTTAARGLVWRRKMLRLAAT